MFVSPASTALLDAHAHSPPILSSKPIGITTRRQATTVPPPSTLPPPSSSLLSRPSSINSNAFSNPHLPDPIAASGRTKQATLENNYLPSAAKSSNGLSRYIVNTCYLVWPVSERSDTENTEGAKLETWQFPVHILSHRIPSLDFYEGL